MLSIKSIIVLSAAIFGAAIAENPVQEKRCAKPPANPNMRPCGKGPKPCPPIVANVNRRFNPACPLPCGVKPCPEPSSSSSSSSCDAPLPIYASDCHSSTHCSESSSSSSECEPSSSSHHHHEHRRPHHEHPRCSPVSLDVNGGWYKFKFGPCGSTVSKSFDFVTVGPSVLRITDLVCSGDAFSVYDNGALILQTPFVGGDNCHQADKEVGPHRAYDSEHYSHGRVNLAPGAHCIKIVVTRAPKSCGVGAIRVDSVMCQCPRELNGLKVVNTPVPFHKAEGVCKAMGMRLADLDIYNFLDATTLAFECAGAFSASWIKSYWKNDYCNTGIALYTGASAPGGSINVPASPEEHLPVICQVIPEGCGGESSSSSSSSIDCSYANDSHVCCDCGSSSSKSCSEEPEPSCSESSSTEEVCSSSSSSSSCSSSSHHHRHHRPSPPKKNGRN